MAVKTTKKIVDKTAKKPVTKIKDRKLVTTFWKKSDKVLDSGINSSMTLGKKTEATGKKILSVLQGESKELIKKTKTAGKQLKKQTSKLQSELKPTSKSQKHLEILKTLAELKKQKIVTIKEYNDKKKELLKKI